MKDLLPFSPRGRIACAIKGEDEALALLFRILRKGDEGRIVKAGHHVQDVNARVDIRDSSKPGGDETQREG